jgi:predicted GIY-YIG superfamily endonuclease
LAILKISRIGYFVITIPVVNQPKKTNDWKLVYTEIFQTKSEAAKRELAIKKKKSRKYIEWLISSAG